MNYYDLIYLTNIPAFYKINLFNKIAEQKRIFVIFLKDHSASRNDDFYKGTRNFDMISLEGKNLLSQLLIIARLLRRIDYHTLIIGGWDNILFWFAAFTSPKLKNAVVVESSFYESETNGFKGFMKKIFLNRCSKSYASGKAQKQLLQGLNFRGSIIITKGVGIINFCQKPDYHPRGQVKNFMYVGRLACEKNLKYLIDTFNNLSEYNLNIIGFGPLETELKMLASTNIFFHGAIDNSKLCDYYKENDVLILPSLSEPWGLVVEEALSNGLPVIVSEKVGCASEIISHDYNGIIFSFSGKNNLHQAILKMAGIEYYNSLRKNISQVNYLKIADDQVNCYVVGL